MKMRELKDYLQDILNNLEENYEDDEDVVVVDNTYWLKGGYHFMTTPKGYVDLDYPTKVEDDEDDF